MVKKCFEKKFDNVIPLIVFTSLRMEAMADRHIFKQFGFTAASFRIMALVNRMGKASPGDIVELLGFSKSNLTQRLGFLVKSGLVDKEKGGADGRRLLVRLTPEGKRRFKQAFKLAKRLNDSLQSLFHGQDMDSFFNFMEKLNYNLDKAEKAAR
jgi:DNA-binding MarR family transcriptional regulator